MNKPQASSLPLLFATFLCVVTHAQESQIHAWQQYADVAEAGFSAEGLEAARRQAIEIDTAAFFVTHRGKVLLAWGEVDRLYRCHSVRKSFLSALIGIHADKGDIDLDATLEELGIDDIEPLSAEESSAKVTDLLSARSGIYHPAARETPDMWRNRLPRGSHAPGEHFLYNNWDFNTLGTIFMQETGEDLFGSFKALFADPLHMQDFQLSSCYYQLEPGKSQYPAYVFRMSARDMARFGQLFLQQGRWGEQQIVSEEWVAESTRAHSKLTPTRGYGYMWWVYPGQRGKANGLASSAYDKFSANGTGGQLILVIPELEMVFVHRGDTDNDRRVSGGRVWDLVDRVLAAMTSPASKEPSLIPVSSNALGEPGPLPQQHIVVAIDSTVLDDYVGTYSITQGRTMRIFRHANHIFGRSGQEETQLLPMARDTFFVRPDDLEFEFLRDRGGKVHAVRAKQKGSEFLANKLR